MIRSFNISGLTATWFLPVVVLLVSVCLASCSAPGNDYAEYRNIPSEGWKYGDTLTFTPVHPDSICRGRIVVGVRHESDFRYSTLWLEVSVEDGKRVRRDTVGIPLADSFGSWLGKGIGASFQATDTAGGYFNHVSGSAVKIRHIMRCDTLRGITQTGVFFVPAE